MAFITCKNLELGYKDQLVATGINFTVEKGDYLYVIGENGAGKSTLMKTFEADEAGIGRNYLR